MDPTSYYGPVRLSSVVNPQSGQMQIGCGEYIDEETVPEEYLDEDFSDETESDGSMDDELFQESWYFDEANAYEIPVTVCGYCHQCGWYVLLDAVSHPEESDSDILPLLKNFIFELHRYEDPDCGCFELEVTADHNCS